MQRRNTDYTLATTRCIEKCTTRDAQLIVGKELYNKTQDAEYGLTSDFTPFNDVPLLLAQPSDGCSAYTGKINVTGFMTGKPWAVAAYRNGTCTFDERTKIAQAAGAVALVILNVAGKTLKPKMICADRISFNCSTLNILTLLIDVADNSIGLGKQLAAKQAANKTMTLDVTCETRNSSLKLTKNLELCAADLTTTSTTTVTVTTTTTTTTNVTTLRPDPEESDSEDGLVVVSCIVASILLLCLIAAVVIKKGGYSKRILSRVAARRHRTRVMRIAPADPAKEAYVGSGPPGIAAVENCDDDAEKTRSSDKARASIAKVDMFNAGPPLPSTMPTTVTQPVS